MSADVADIRIGKGIVSFFETDATTTEDLATAEESLRDLGWVPSFDITQDITEKDYNSAREGIATVAETFITKLKATVKFRMDSVIGENLAFFAMSDVDSDSDGNIVLMSLSKTTFRGILKCAGTNDTGRRVDWIAKVSLRPTGDLSLITDGDDFTGVQMEATAIRTDAYSYGKYTVYPAE